MVVVFAAIIIFIVVLALLWPRHGLLARWRLARHLARREAIEDALKHIHARELRGNLATTESLAGALDLSMARALRVIDEMHSGRLIQMKRAGLELTPHGRTLALHVIRAHRLLERYLADELQMPIGEIHTTADRREHTLMPAEADELEARLGYPRLDPHGDPIPTATGSLAGVEGVALTEWPTGEPARIVHLEDEPPEVFEQIATAGLRPGMPVEVLEANERRLVIWDGEREYLLSPVAAANVFVSEWPEAVGPPLRLSALEPGELGRVVALRCEGLSRRRLLDLGLTPGTVVESAFAGPVGEPTAYHVRGALIALRPEQANQIEIERMDRETVGE